jgi:hypothetical protein
MPTIELVLRDDDNRIIGQRSAKRYSLNLSSQSFHDIEGAVENFKKAVLPDVELDLLEAAQSAFVRDKKRSDL